MTIEQIILLLKICGFALWVPLIVFVVGAIVSFQHMKNPPEIPEPAEPQSAPVAEESQQTPSTGSGREKSDRKPRGRKQEAAPAEPVREPIVTERIPDIAQQTLAEIWSKFPPIHAQWICISKQEDMK